ncbi:type IV pilus twitching motility protein PilT [Martelella alba]|uniref:PilT/PilU family type 4a pilus ATPase n=1 Tax=Martelella alba TaxID=2590451 RepID=A0ABY2SEU7_9HYPH|nr:PilT/PilU family type 4a pilus ATPase [Martelella alba]TKI03087.1 PilT/PilU family type 4a pilus ATPase [Martelella alba]
MDMDELVAHSVKHNASDLHLCPGLAPIIRIDGELRRLATLPRINDENMNDCCARILDKRARATLAATGQADAAAAFAGGGRVRAHFFRQRSGVSAALRLIPERIPDWTAIGIPPAVAGLLDGARGLLLAVGAAGSGKSASLAAMVHYLNHRRRLHIVTLEDPIEYIHQSALALIQQREIGRHCLDFHAGLHAALRQDPDVLVIGELRGASVIRLALAAAETGHLVLGTLHARHAWQAADRIIESFPSDEQGVARIALADALLAILAQRLVPTGQGGRQALFELMIATPAARNLIRTGKTHLLPGLVQSGGEQGMRTFEQDGRRRGSDSPAG